MAHVLTVFHEVTGRCACDGLTTDIASAPQSSANHEEVGTHEWMARSGDVCEQPQRLSDQVERLRSHMSDRAERKEHEQRFLSQYVVIVS